MRIEKRPSIRVIIIDSSSMAITSSSPSERSLSAPDAMIESRRFCSRIPYSPSLLKVYTHAASETWGQVGCDGNKTQYYFIAKPPERESANKRTPEIVERKAERDRKGPHRSYGL